jgi:hypothetical protein
MAKFQCKELGIYQYPTYYFSFGDEFKICVNELFTTLNALITTSVDSFNILVDCSDLDASTLLTVFGSLCLDDFTSLGKGCLHMFILVTSSSVIKNTANFLISCKGASDYAIICDSMSCASSVLLCSNGTQTHE